MEKEKPKIGTATWVRKNGKVLLGVRNNKLGYGEWCPPGGHLEMNETLEECAIRETREESGLNIENIKIILFQENIWKEMRSHYITFHLSADWVSGEAVPKQNEFKNLEWFDWGKLPSPLFYPARLFVESGINPLEI